MEESKGEECENQVNERNQKESGCVKTVEKRVDTSTQVELNRKWISWHTLVAPEYWDEELGLKVKKEEPWTPRLLNIKVKSPPTPNLQYPLKSPTTPSSCYCSLDPNDFENWGDLATA